jgi:hypothetical protein
VSLQDEGQTIALDEKVRLLRERFAATFGGFEQSLLKTRSRAIVGTLINLPDSKGGRLAAAALTKLQTGQRPTPAEFSALEYMIRAVRPAPLVTSGPLPAKVPLGRNVDPETLEDFQRAFPGWEDFRAPFPGVARSIGRISALRGFGSPPEPQGTGFLVADDVIITNAHVLYLLSSGQNQLQEGQAMIEFRCEAEDTDDEPAYSIVSVIAISDEWDACLLRLGQKTGGTPLTFATEEPKLLDQIAAVGFPYPDPKRDPAFTDLIFKDSFGLKRAAPGLITETQERTSMIYHDCSTLGGNSGSPLLSLKDCTVVGLHTGGGFLWKNTSVDARSLAPWMRKELGNG